MESRREFLGHRLFDATALAAAAALPAGLPAQTESSRQIRMGVVGGGFGTHFDWHEHPNSTVAAVTDLRADRRDALQTKYRCDTVYNSLEEMLRRPEDLDAVAIFSGAPDHFKHVSMCMERGLHVISAVPAVMTLEEADGLRDLKERTGLRYMMAETSYYRQPTIYARNLHAESGFGEVFYTELEYYHDRGDLEALLVDKTSRFYEPDGSRTWRWGLPPMHYPTHCLGFLVGVTKERIERVSCLGWGGEHAWLEDNRYDNPYWCQSALMQTRPRQHVSLQRLLVRGRPRRTGPLVWRARIVVHGGGRASRGCLAAAFEGLGPKRACPETRDSGLLEERHAAGSDAARERPRWQPPVPCGGVRQRPHRRPRARDRRVRIPGDDGAGDCRSPIVAEEWRAARRSEL